MVEARIICLIPFIRIPDLNLAMVKDQEAYVEEKAARESVDLDVVLRAGGVQVHFIERSRTIRPPDSPLLPSLPAPKRGFRAPVAAKAEIDLEALAAKVAEKLVSQAMGPGDGRKLDALLDAVGGLRRELRDSGNSDVRRFPSGGKVGTEDDVPVFIPERIMNDSLGTINVGEGDGVSGEGLDKAAEALKEFRKRRKIREGAGKE